MFDFIKQNKWVVRTVLVIALIPFLFFGVDWYFRGGSSNQDVAVVGKTHITVQQFDQLLNAQRKKIRDRTGESALTTPEERAMFLASVLENELLLEKARTEHLQASDNLLRHYISSVPEFQEKGKFSPDVYRSIAAANNFTPAGLDFELKKGLLVDPVSRPVKDGEFATKQAALSIYRLATERREVQLAVLMASEYQKDVRVTDDEINAYYQENASLFMLPEAVSIEYIKLSRDALLKEVNVTAEEERQEYNKNLARYLSPETRQIAHILIAAPESAAAEKKEQAKAKAQALLAKLQANPKDFARVAKESSEDPGSAGKGGDLGTMQPGFVKPFEVAVTEAKESGIIDHLVETEFGYHIIKVNIVPSRQQSFEEVKAKIEDDLKQSRATQLYAQRAELLKNKVFEVADSYADAAKELGVSVSNASFLTRAQVAQIGEGDQKFADEVFSPNSLEGKLNTEAMDVGRDTIISARVLQYKPASVKPLDEVLPAIRETLQKNAALNLAIKDGEAKLAELKSGGHPSVLFGQVLSIDRQTLRSDIPAGMKRDIFKTPASKIPAYFGDAVDGDRFVIVKLDKVIENKASLDAEAKEIETILRAVKGEELYRSYITVLNEKAKMHIFEERFKAVQ